MKKKIIILLIGILTTGVLVACDTKTKMQATPDSLVPYIDDYWVAVWADEFNGDELDLDKWTYEINDGGGGNNELQYYTDENLEVSDGTLKIEARKERYKTRDYTSSRIVSKYKGDFKYGRIVTSAKMPSGRGVWPAIWMMPTQSKYGTWPRSGEIDIMEYVGYDPNVFHSTIHTAKLNHMAGTQVGKSIKVSNAETEFHVFETIWEPGVIESYINGELYFSYKYTAAFHQEVPYYEVFPFDELFFLIINLAIGGDWGGAQGVDESIFPTTLEVDYIRVYQKDYEFYDKSAPNKPTYVNSSNSLKNSIFWRESSDDMGVEYYNVYLDGEFYGKTNLPQITLEKLTKGKTYNIEIEAVDFTGKTSELSEGFTYIFE